jgi:hypothetical protein
LKFKSYYVLLRFSLLAMEAVLYVSLVAFGTSADSGTATLNAPSGATFATFTVGVNTGSALTPGTVDASGPGWTLTVEDTKLNNKGKMTVGGEDGSGAIKLTDPILVGMTSGSVSTISSYQSALQAASGYGTTGSFSMPLHFEQIITAGDKAGIYKITLVYTVTPPPD